MMKPFQAITGNRTLMLFLGLSVVAHGALFLGQGDQYKSASKPIGQTLIQATLVTSARTEKNKTARQQQSNAGQSLWRPRSERTDNRSHITETSKTAEENSESHEAQNFLSGKLQSELNRYLIYPHIARLRGWEGKVVLQLKLKENGGFDDIKVVKSSGYRLLDDTALEAMNKLNENSTQISWLQGYNTELLLPIIYRLTSY
ncbi:MAG: TonB family protein [Gammaproteobacteria bacterium]|nr:TonB family protein [Gammaproteobacteria bacterium]